MSTDGEFTIATWNVHLGRHNDGGINDVVARCGDIDTDVLVIQEGWWENSTGSMIDEICSAHGYELHEHLASRPSTKASIGNWRVALLSRLEATRLDDVVLPPLRQLAVRAMVRVKLRASGLSISAGHVYGIHALRRDPRVWMAERHVFAEVARASDVVLGDLNMWGPVVDHDAGPLRRAVIGRTWPSVRPHSQIDHILVGERVEVVRGAVLADLGSDHRAVRATLRRVQRD